MSKRQAVHVFLVIAAGVLVPLVAGIPAVADNGQQDAEALISRLRELLLATETKVIVVPFPNSRSRILMADGNAEFFLYIERANLRGTEEISVFYAALESGDMVAAADVFTRHSMVSLRASDYGWNGLGVPFERPDGSDQIIEDRLYKTAGGVFGRVEITAEDAARLRDEIRSLRAGLADAGS